jgi:hypothetical protein
MALGLKYSIRERTIDWRFCLILIFISQRCPCETPLVLSNQHRCLALYPTANLAPSPYFPKSEVTFHVLCWTTCFALCVVQIAINESWVSILL